MQIEKNTVVSFHYTLSDETGQTVENSRDGDQPTVYLHGANNILPGLESALAGKQTGDKVTVTLEPSAAFGNKEDNAVQRVPAKYLKHEGRLNPGKTVRISTDKGTRIGTVVKVGKFNVDVDMNHPLAGQSVTFDIAVIDVREASSEELAHGHAHGPGGHHHH